MRHGWQDGFINLFILILILLEETVYVRTHGGEGGMM